MRKLGMALRCQSSSRALMAGVANCHPRHEPWSPAITLAVRFTWIDVSDVFTRMEIVPEAHERCESGYTSNYLHALHATFSLECYPRSSTGALAKPLPVVANGDLLRSQNAANTFHRILGVRVAGEKQFMAVPEVDGRDGTIRATEA